MRRPCHESVGPRRWLGQGRVHIVQVSGHAGREKSCSTSGVISWEMDNPAYREEESRSHSFNHKREWLQNQSGAEEGSGRGREMVKDNFLQTANFLNSLIIKV